MFRSIIMDMNVLSVLTDKGLVQEGDVAAITKEAGEKDASLETVLGKRGVTVEAILGALSEHYGIPVRILPQGRDIEQAALEFIPQESAEHYKFVPLGIADGALEVGIT